MTEQDKPKHMADENAADRRATPAPEPRSSDPQSSEPQAPAEAAAAAAALDTAGGVMQPSAVPVSAQSGTVPSGADTLVRRIFTGSGMVSVLAVLLALILGGLLIASTDKQVGATASYLFARPSDFLSAVWTAATRSYVALFQGSVFNPRGSSVAVQFAPLMETLTIATPLITAGLGVALAFRAGLFNIGAQGQIIMAGILAAWAGFALHLPLGLHLLLVLVAGIVGGALWGGLVGLLKARTGAHEVILTIMFNYIALYFLRYLLNTPAFQRPGESNPISPILDPTAVYPQIFGTQYRLHLGFVLAIAATVLVWWLLNRSTVGFEFRAVGANPKAALTAGINVPRATVLVMAIAGALAGMSGVAQVAGTEKVLTDGVAATYGFDAITVALLGRSTPWGTFAAGLLFGAFRAGAVQMQIQTGTPIDIVLVVQSLIVLFIAAPPLVRAVFGLNPRKKKAVAAGKSQKAATTGGAA
ncbi:simple sugar transport system permease protein [Arthrobacter sp. PvP102]|uniref:ABC transporter permease n=1 Tax=unclassified Arthrobacter TaxID=235627 RepID=UPI001AE175D0|nr:MULTISPECIES: ABC transporter permease [unclassified Arthrobacter]MBP1234649.1 simple sugar transport system permease protein [Arthrobacter sp. PvP103]MBP1235607.1 simple sugar transport system permease protein [Arthrobacter sp. PvP102]